jgi:hypothetical protein
MKKKTHETYSFRLPMELLKWLREESEKSCRSMAGQLEYVLREVKEKEASK